MEEERKGRKEEEEEKSDEKKEVKWKLEQVFKPRYSLLGFVLQSTGRFISERSEVV